MAAPSSASRPAASAAPARRQIQLNSFPGLVGPYADRVKQDGKRKLYFDDVCLEKFGYMRDGSSVVNEHMLCESDITKVLATEGLTSMQIYTRMEFIVALFFGNSGRFIGSSPYGMLQQLRRARVNPRNHVAVADYFGFKLRIVMFDVNGHRGETIVNEFAQGDALTVHQAMLDIPFFIFVRDEQWAQAFDAAYKRFQSAEVLRRRMAAALKKEQLDAGVATEVKTSAPTIALLPTTKASPSRPPLRVARNPVPEHTRLLEQLGAERNALHNMTVVKRIDELALPMIMRAAPDSPKPSVDTSNDEALAQCLQDAEMDDGLPAPRFDSAWDDVEEDKVAVADSKPVLPPPSKVFSGAAPKPTGIALPASPKPVPKKAPAVQPTAPKKVPAAQPAVDPLHIPINPNEREMWYQLTYGAFNAILSKKPKPNESWEPIVTAMDGRLQLSERVRNINMIRVARLHADNRHDEAEALAEVLISGSVDPHQRDVAKIF